LLHRNVIRDNLDIVHLLIDCGADTNFVDEMVYTPLHCAALMPRAYRQNRESIARLLLIRGANPNATNPRGQTPLHIAAEEGYAKCIRLLLDHGADPNVCDSYGETPLDL
ncbi:ankyrin repeat protein, partial [Schizophyllum amplum]